MFKKEKLYSSELKVKRLDCLNEILEGISTLYFEPDFACIRLSAKLFKISKRNMRFMISLGT